MTRAHWLVLVSYLAALATGWLALQYFSHLDLLPRLLIADVLATVVIFAVSLTCRNSSVYDPYWSVIPVAMVAWLVLQPGEAAAGRQLLVAIVVGAWGVRLTANWLYTWRGLDHVDWRYVNLEAQAGVFWWPLSFLGVHLMPTLIVLLACTPLVPALVTGDAPLNLIDGAALVLGLASIWLEFQADRELHRFRAGRSSRAAVLDTGLWSWCRHPNYLGEIGFWVAVFGFGYASTGYPERWMSAGPVVMFGLFALVSIPMIERKLLADKPDYAAYRERTFALLPFSRLR